MVPTWADQPCPSVRNWTRFTSLKLVAKLRTIAETASAARLSSPVASVSIPCEIEIQDAELVQENVTKLRGGRARGHGAFAARPGQFLEYRSHAVRQNGSARDGPLFLHQVGFRIVREEQADADALRRRRRGRVSPHAGRTGDRSFEAIPPRRLPYDTPLISPRVHQARWSRDAKCTEHGSGPDAGWGLCRPSRCS
jgi:hypothetical protein